MRFAFLPVASILHEEGPLGQLSRRYAEALERRGGKRGTVERIDSDDLPMVFLVLTGGTERRILDLWEEWRRVGPDQPLWLVAHPGHNALPAALEVLARLQQDGVIGQVIYLQSPEDEAGLERLDGVLRGWEAYRAMQGLRIGLVGDPSDWLVASSPDAEILRAGWGVEVVHLPMEQLYAAIDAVADEDVATLEEELFAGAQEVREPDRATVHEAVRVYVGLRQVVEQERLDAVTVRCFDLVLNRQTTGCFALAQLNDEGVIAGCEGDLVSTLGMVWAYRLTGELPWMANPAQVNEEEGLLWLAHCTVPRSLVQGYILRSHFESGLGVGIQGDWLAGPITLLRLGGRAVDRLWVAEGQIVRAGRAEDLCRTQIGVRVPGERVRELLESPLGNHLVVLRGHHASMFEAWWHTYRMRQA